MPTGTAPAPARLSNPRNVASALTTDAFLNPPIPSARVNVGASKPSARKAAAPNGPRVPTEAETRVLDARKRLACDALYVIASETNAPMDEWSKPRLYAYCVAAGLTGLSGLSRDNLLRKAQGDDIVKPEPKAGSLAALRVECVAQGMRQTLASRLDRDALNAFLETGQTPDKPLNTREKLNSLASRYKIAGRSKMSTADLLDALFAAGADDDIEATIGADKVKDIADRAEKEATYRETGFRPGVSRDIVRFACIASGEAAPKGLNNPKNADTIIALADRIVSGLLNAESARKAG